MQTGEIIIYQGPDGQTAIDVTLENETVWLNQAQIVDLFQSSKANVSEHVKHIFQSRELDTESTVRNFRTVRQEGKRTVNRKVAYYNLDIIISIGYRVNSIRVLNFQMGTNALRLSCLYSF